MQMAFITESTVKSTQHAQVEQQTDCSCEQKNLKELKLTATPTLYKGYQTHVHSLSTTMLTWQLRTP